MLLPISAIAERKVPSTRSPRVGKKSAAPHRHYAFAPVLGGVELLSAVYRHHRFTPHSHEAAVIGVVEHGNALVFSAGQRLLLSRGSVLVIPPQVLHDSYNIGRETWHYRALYLDVQQIAQLTTLPSVATGLLGTRPFVLDAGDIAEQVIAVHDSLGAVGGGCHTALLDDMRSLICALDIGELETSSQPRSEQRIAAGVARVRRAIDADPLRRRTLTEMATIAELTRFSFAHAFSRAYGVAPHRYVAQRRLGTAREMLMVGEPISRVAHQVGFADQSHLTRRFLSVFGVAPGEFQRAWQRAQQPTQQPTQQLTRHAGRHPALLPKTVGSNSPDNIGPARI